MTQYDGAWLDKMYNNRALVPDFAQYLQRWATQSAQVRDSEPSHLDVAYGLGPQETLDIFRAKGGADKAPVLVFIHGGFWRALDKSDHSFVAPAFTAEGACVVVPNYALCPAVTIPDITMQMVKALAWVWRNIAQYGGDPARITVVGHSAGGHLAAMMLACRWADYAGDLPGSVVGQGMSISGLHELESIRFTPYLNGDLRLTAQDALRASPAWMPGISGRTLMALVGADESAEFLRQNQLIQQQWGERIVPVCQALPGLNHFSMLDALVQPGHGLHALALKGLFNLPLL